MLNYEKLKDNARDFLAATGLTVEEFHKLLPHFESAYEKLYPGSKTFEGKPRLRRKGAGAQGSLHNFADRLLFILVYQKTNPLQTMHGLQFDMSQPQANYWIHRLLPALRESLAEMGHRPQREGRLVATSPLMMESAPDLAIDGTERQRQRPKDEGKQKQHYSGKKKAHTDKNLILMNENTGKVIYLGPTTEGKTHDKKMADSEQISYPLGARLDKDTGFQGYEPAGVLTQQPKKSPEEKS